MGVREPWVVWSFGLRVPRSQGLKVLRSTWLSEISTGIVILRLHAPRGFAAKPQIRVRTWALGLSIPRHLRPQLPNHRLIRRQGALRDVDPEREKGEHALFDEL